MIAHYGITQQTEEWFEIKWGKIGGTRSKGLFVKSDTLLIELLAESLEPFEMDFDSYASPAMIRGNEMEPLARSEVSKYLGIELHECGWLQSESNPLLGISVDGISADQTVTAEIKCPEAKRHIATCLADEIPRDNIHQSLHYFTVNPKMERHYFTSFRPEFKLKPLFVKELTRASMVDIGWTKKVKEKEDRGLGMKEYVNTVPDIRSIADWVAVAKSEEVQLRKEIEQSINKLKF